MSDASNTNALVYASMCITKASLSNGVMRWAATSSDTDPDAYNERMSLELYEDFISHIENEDEIPAEYKSLVCSDYWCGGMPYLSISHYPDLNGKAVPGEPLEVYIDGQKLKAKGVLFDTPLGHSVWRSLKEDRHKSQEERIRISIGFLDFAHKHGENGRVWVREGLHSLCPDCLHGVKDKIYLKGYLVHLALTRVPVNQRTEMVLEEKADMAKKTRKEDAASIIPPDMAEELDTLAKTSVHRSDVLVEMSDDDKYEVLSDDEDVTEDDALAALSEVVEKGYGGYLVEDNGEGKPALPTMKDGKLSHRLMGAAWAALHGGFRGRKYEGKGKKEAIAKLKKLYEKEGMPLPGENMPEKSDAVAEPDDVEKAANDDAMGKVVQEPVQMMENMPYGGATSMKDAQEHMAMKNEMLFIMDAWDVFANVVWNIIQRDDVKQKKEYVVKAVDEFRNMLAAKAMVAFADYAHREEHELKPAIDALLAQIDNSVQMKADVSDKLASINPSLQELGEKITEYVTAKSQQQPVPKDENKDTLLEELKSIVQPLQEAIANLQSEVGIIKSQANARSVETRQRIPPPRTIAPTAFGAQAAEKPKPGSIRDIVNRSVGLA